MRRMVHPARRATGMMVLGCVQLVSALPAARPSPAGEPLSASPDARTVKPVDFNREVRPILSKNCFACHGSDEAKRVKGLRLDQREAAVKPLESGEAAIVPGDADSSNLVARISEEDDTVRMPPRKAGNRLSPAKVDVLTRWVRQGAKYVEHWALIPPRAETLPKVMNAAWPRNGLDCWILARLEQEGLHPSPEADPYTLLRRVSLDLRRLLDDTIVVWGGELGRTSMNEARGGSTFLGRDHHPHCFTLWVAGGGFKNGISLGATDDLGYQITENPVTVHDLQATILHLLGLDAEKFRFPYQGLQQRLIGVEGDGRVRKELLA